MTQSKLAVPNRPVSELLDDGRAFIADLAVTSAKATTIKRRGVLLVKEIDTNLRHRSALKDDEEMKLSLLKARIGRDVFGIAAPALED